MYCTNIAIHMENFFTDATAQAQASSGMDAMIATAIGLLVLVAVFQMAPMLGDSIEQATDFGHNVSAYGVLDVDGSVADGETVTVGTVVFEFDSVGGVTPGNAAVPINDTTASTAVAALSTAIGNNETTSAIVTATAGGA